MCDNEKKTCGWQSFEEVAEFFNRPFEIGKKSVFSLLKDAELN